MMARATCLLVAVTALAAPCAALVTAPGLGVVRGGVLRGSFVSAAAARNSPYLMPRRACRSLAPLRGGAAASRASLSPDFILKTFAPLMGGLISATMSFSPMPAVVEARKTKALGELNLTPYPAQCGNAAAWLSYGILVSNSWIIVPNVVGLLTGLFFCYTGYSLGNATQKGALFRSFASYMSVIGLALLCALNGVFNIAAKEVMGRVAIGLLMIYYCSPLRVMHSFACAPPVSSTIAKVLQTKDSSSIDGALTMVGIVNGCFWGTYGLAIADIYVYGPNLVGAAIAAVTSLVWFIYRVK